MCNVYEVLSSNHLKLLYSRSHKDIISFLMTSEKDTNPNVLLIDLDENLISQIELRQKSKKKESELAVTESESESDSVDFFEVASAEITKA